MQLYLMIMLKLQGVVDEPGGDPKYARDIGVTVNSYLRSPVGRVGESSIVIIIYMVNIHDST